MKILNIKYVGEGSEKQADWASSIFGAEIEKISAKLETAKSRVSDKSMPESWLDSWVNVLNNPKAIAAVERFASQSASDTIAYKGLKSKSGASLAAILESLVNKEFKAS